MKNVKWSFVLLLIDSKVCGDVTLTDFLNKDK